MMRFKDRVYGGLVGVVVGDAVGYPVQFTPRELLKERPVEGLSGRVLWSDDSSLTLCTVESLCNGYDLNDIAEKFCKWFTDGYWTPTGEALDIGATTYKAINRLLKGVSPRRSGLKGEYDNGNGSLMRILPIALYFYKASDEELLKKTHEVSSITHAHPRSLVGCGIYVLTVKHLLEEMDSREAYLEACRKALKYYDRPPYNRELKYYERVLNGRIYELREEEVLSTGYVVHTLEASLWTFLTTRSFREAVLKAVNLGGDADTIGAVTGGLAGVYYGFKSIPQEWIWKIPKINEILRLIGEFYQAITT